jgi:hypothetical protein
MRYRGPGQRSRESADSSAASNTVRVRINLNTIPGRKTCPPIGLVKVKPLRRRLVAMTQGETTDFVWPLSERADHPARLA